MRVPYRLLELKWKLCRKWEGERILRRTYSREFRRVLSVEDPSSFTEKLFARMVLIDRFGNPRFSMLADKLQVREFVRSVVGDTYLVPLLWFGDSPQDIPFEQLPKEFVAKTTHDSGSTYVYGRNDSPSDLVRFLNSSLRGNYYWHGREYHYYSIPPRVIIEERLEEPSAAGVLDYKLYCFHGEPLLIQVDNPARSINPFYDVDWRFLDLKYRSGDVTDCAVRPNRLDEMLQVARALSKDFDFVRVDLYSPGDRVYFGELTFTPMAGVIHFDPDSWDQWLGERWDFQSENQFR